MAEQPQGDKEKLDFLKREEVRTMAKDIAKLRREEVEKERKRIADIKIEQKRKKEEKPQQPIKEEQPQLPIKEEEPNLPAMDKAQISLAPEAKTPNISVPKPLSHTQKVIIRLVIGFIIVFLLVNAGLFVYWYFIKEAVPQEPIEQTVPIQQPTLPVKEEPTPPSEITIQPLEIIDRPLSFGFEIPDAPRSIDTIIIHSAHAPLLENNSLNIDSMIDEFKTFGVSPHYLISQEGIVYHLVKDEDIAYHAGASSMPDGRINISLFSIGIDLVYLQTASPTDIQYQTLAQLVKELSAKYAVPSKNILGHQEISPTRKTDPWNFDWDFFRSLLE